MRSLWMNPPFWSGVLVIVFAYWHEKRRRKERDEKPREDRVRKAMGEGEVFGA